MHWESLTIFSTESDCCILPSGLSLRDRPRIWSLHQSIQRFSAFCWSGDIKKSATASGKVYPGQKTHQSTHLESSPFSTIYLPGGHVTAGIFLWDASSFCTCVFSGFDRTCFWCGFRILWLLGGTNISGKKVPNVSDKTYMFPCTASRRLWARRASTLFGEASCSLSKQGFVGPHGTKGLSFMKAQIQLIFIGHLRVASPWNENGAPASNAQCEQRQQCVNSLHPCELPALNSYRASYP